MSRAARRGPPVAAAGRADARRAAASAGCGCARGERCCFPSFAVPLGLGALIAGHGLLLAFVAPGGVVSIAWVAGLVAARPLLRWRARRERSGRPQATDRLLVACVAAGVVAAVAATLLGASPMISAVAAATAARALLAGQPLVGLAAVTGGLVANAVLLQGAAPAPVELFSGTALVVVGLAWRGLRRAA